MGVKLCGGRVIAEGQWDVRGTLDVDREAPVLRPHRCRTDVRIGHRRRCRDGEALEMGGCAGRRSLPDNKEQF